MEREYEYFIKNRETIVKGHINQYVIISSEKILGYFGNEEEALKNTDYLKEGDFIIQKCIPQSQEIQNYFSRVMFV